MTFEKENEMPGSMFDDDGRLKIPQVEHVQKEAHGPAVVVNAVYCPKKHNLVSLDHSVSGYPAIVVRFSGKRSGEGLLALSAVLGDRSTCILEGGIEPQEPLDMLCPHCGVPLDVLASCPCQPGAVSVMAYLYPNRDPHQAIAFCNTLSCPNSAIIRSGEVIRRFSE